MAELFAYTDGACSGNPGPGGWGVLMQAKDGQTVLKQRDLKGGEAVTTNNRMELLAAINALEALERPSEITIFTDSTLSLIHTSRVRRTTLRNNRRGACQLYKKKLSTI